MQTKNDYFDVSRVAPEDYYNNLYAYLSECLKILCEEVRVPEPPLLLINERYHSAEGWYSIDESGSNMIYIDIKAQDYVGTLLHEFAHHIGFNEAQAEEFRKVNRMKFQMVFNKGTLT